jgi:hypothetical protein
MLAGSDVPAAQTAVEELDRVAALFRSPFLAASAAQWGGAVRLAEGDAGAALPLLRQGWSGWRSLDAHYEAARCRVAIGLACRALGDEDAAQMELDAAGGRSPGWPAESRTWPGSRHSWTRPTDDAVTPARHGPDGPRGGGAAAGGGRRHQPGIAADLFLSEKTVAAT